MNLTRITAEVPSSLTKRFTLEQGKLVRHKGGMLVKGTYETLSTTTPDALSRVLNAMQPNQALTYGVPLNAETKGRIASRKEAQPGDVTRTRDAFAYVQGPSFLMLDIDPAPKGTPHAPATDWDSLYAYLDQVIPGFKETVPHVTAHSASTHLFTGEGKQLLGEGGKRIYVLVAEGTDIPRAGAALYKRLQLAGGAHLMISKNGVTLHRSVIDASTFCPEKLDFCAGAQTGPGLVQKRPPASPLNTNQPPLDTRKLLPELNAAECQTLDALLHERRAAVEPERAKAREQWLEEHMKHKPADVSPEEFRETLNRAADSLLLDASFPVPVCDDKNKVSYHPVSELLSAPQRWNGRLCLDPVEPSYDNGRPVGRLYLTGPTAVLYSFAHGGRKYLLNKRKHALQVCEGHTEDLTDAVLNILAANNVLYRSGDSLVEIRGHASPVINQPDIVESHLDRQIRFFSSSSKGQKNVDCPPKVARRIMIKQNQWKFHELSGITTLPVMRLDGSVIENPGYDTASRLMYTPEIEQNDPQEALEGGRVGLDMGGDVKRALARLWAPFRMFPFAGDTDRGSALAAILTTAVRPVLPAAPGFLINAPSFGTGKTLFAQTIAAMSGGESSLLSWPNTAEEQRKTLTAMLRYGYSAVVIDNLEGNLASADLAAIFTTPVWNTRLLGKSEDLSLRTNLLILATGNNVYPIRDLGRRFCTIRINAESEHPERRVFDFSPLTMVQANPLAYRMDALTVLRGCAGRTTTDVMGSFEAWDRLVRQCVCKVAQDKLLPGIDDPINSVDENAGADPDAIKLQNLLEAWHAAFAGKPTTVKELITGTDVIASPDNSDLADAIEAIADDRKGSRGANPRILAWYLERHKDCVAGGLRLRKSELLKKRATLYVVEPLRR